MCCVGRHSQSFDYVDGSTQGVALRSDPAPRRRRSRNSRDLERPSPLFGVGRHPESIRIGSPTLSHNGVRFLDELLFRRDALE